MSTLIGGAMLVILWLLAWGDLSVANVVSGILLAAVLLVAFPVEHHPGARVVLRLSGIGRLVAYVVMQLVTSNLLVARVILSPRSRVRTGVLAYRLRHPSDAVITLMANIIALSPGTMTVEATRSPATIYVHFLLLRSVEEARRSIARLEDVTVAAIGPRSPPTESQPTHPQELP